MNVHNHKLSAITVDKHSTPKTIVYKYNYHFHLVPLVSFFSICV